MKLKYIISSSILAVSLLGCTSNFDDYNTNPNETDMGTISPSALLEETLNSGASALLDRTRLINGELIQYTVSGSGLNSYHRYAINNAIQAGSWDGSFQWAANANHMYELADKFDPEGTLPVYNNCRAIALTLRTLYLSSATDIFGDIPCSEAFKGREENMKPVFDTQKDVYISLFNSLEEANSLYSVTVSIPNPTKDLMYQGDMAKWKKFTNSLYLRLLMRLSNRDSEMGISAKIQEILNKPNVYPIFESNSDNATLYYTGIKPFANRFGDDVWGSSGDRKCAENIIELMYPTSDPRLPRYFVKRGNEWKGLPSGEYLSDGDTDGVAYIKKETLGSPTSPYSFIKYDEVQFIIAEAAKRGMVTGGEALVESAYNKALRASIEWWYSVDPTLTTDEKNQMTTVIDEYVNQKMKYNGSMSQLLNQKYIAMFWVGYEAWNDYRRTGYPVLRIGSETQNDHVLPTRFSYPERTSSTNPDNYAIAVNRLKTMYKGTDNMKTPVWWSKQGASIYK